MIALKPKKIAAALKYKPGIDTAPKLIAKGFGQVAENILRQAKQHDIPVYEDQKLAQQLESLAIGKEVPPDLYEAVAEILVFISRMDQKNKLFRGL